MLSDAGPITRRVGLGSGLESTRTAVIETDKGYTGDQVRMGEQLEVKGL